MARPGRGRRSGGARDRAAVSSAVLAFDDGRHVAQLQLRRYEAGQRSPTGLDKPLSWMDFEGHAPPLPEHTVAVFRYHVGQTDDTDARRVTGAAAWAGSCSTDGSAARQGIAAPAAELGVDIKQTGPVQLPNLSFDGDEHFERALVFADECARRGVFVHPSHNWFLSSAHTEDDVSSTLDAMGRAFARVAAELGTA